MLLLLCPSKIKDDKIYCSNFADTKDTNRFANISLFAVVLHQSAEEKKTINIANKYCYLNVKQGQKLSMRT